MAARRLLTAALALLCLLSMGFEWEGRLSRLRRDLSTGDAAQRREVVRLLGTYPARDVGPSLLMALTDPDPGVRSEAAEAAGRVQLREAVPRLLEWLEDSDADVRASAARALGRIADPRTVTPLVRALGDSHADVRRAAVSALSNLGTPEVVVPLLGRLDDTDSSVRVDAAEALGRLSDGRAVVPLVGRARDDTPEVRVAVHTALGELGDRRALPALLQGLRDEAEAAQLAAVASVGRLGSEDAIEPLVTLLATPDPRRARAVISALAAIGGPEALDAVVESLGVPATREIATDVLASTAARQRPTEGTASGPVDGQSVIAALTEALDRSGSHAHATAIAAALHRILLERPSEEPTGALLSAVREARGERSVLLRALSATGSPEALVPILERLRSADTDSLPATLEALALFFERHPPDGRAADPLLAALGRVPADQRVRVVQLLGRVRAPRALPALRPLLENRDPALRRAAVEAIGAIGDPEGAPVLVALLTDRDARTRFEAARALEAAASADTVATLVSKLQAREPVDRHAVVLALGGSVGRLRDADNLPEETRRSAVGALIAAARGPDEALAARAIEALGRVGDAEAVEPLVALSRSGARHRRREATLALGGFDSGSALARLREALGDRRVPVRTAAAAALGEHGVATDAGRLLEVAGSAPWPINAAASFSLARLARRGRLRDANRPGLCQLAAARGPFVRANAAIALAATGAPPCEGEADPRRWLGPRHAAVVRAAAVRWLHAAAAAGTLEAAAAQEAVERCRATDLAPDVVRVCQSPSLPPQDDAADVYAYSADGRHLLVDELVAMRLADGTVFVARTDHNGHLRLLHAPRGPLVLDDPVGTPLEP